jgi:hypothetical protein
MSKDVVYAMPCDCMFALSMWILENVPAFELQLIRIIDCNLAIW